MLPFYLLLFTTTNSVSLSYNHDCDFTDRIACINTYGCGWCNNITDKCIPVPICGNMSKIYDICEYRDTSDVCHVSSTMFSLMLMGIFLSISFCILVVLNNLFLRLDTSKGVKLLVVLCLICLSVSSLVALYSNSNSNYKIFEYIFIGQLSLLILFWLCYGSSSVVKVYRNRAYEEYLEINGELTP